MKAGAIDFLMKPVSAARLSPAIRRAIDKDIEQRRIQADRAAADGLFQTLTPRERQVLAHLVTGRLNKQIAGHLGTVEKTIKVHRGRVMKKLQVRNMAELVRFMLRLEKLPAAF